MSTGDTGPTPSDPTAGAGQPGSEEAMRAAYEAEIKKIRVEQIVLEQVVTLINLGMRRTGLTPGTEDERDLDQVQLAIETIRVQLPLIEQITPDQIGAIRDALSQLQMAYVRLGGTSPGAAEAPGGPSGAEAAPGAAPGSAPPAAGPAGPDPGRPGSGESAAEPGGPAQRSGRLWIPGQ